MEMRLFGVHVVTCLPSFHKTPILANRSGMLDKQWKAASAEVKAAYGAAWCVGKGPNAGRSRLRS